MKTYDITLLLSSELTEEQANTTFQEELSSLQEQGGILHKQEIKGKRRLAYPIKNQRNAHLAQVSVSCSPEAIQATRDTIKNHAHVLRFLVAVANRPDPAPRARRESPKEAPRERVEIADIDKKLEEIFKEA